MRLRPIHTSEVVVNSLRDDAEDTGNNQSNGNRCLEPLALGDGKRKEAKRDGDENRHDHENMTGILCECIARWCWCAEDIVERNFCLGRLGNCYARHQDAHEKSGQSEKHDRDNDAVEKGRRSVV